jgi:hypothetical protein
MEKGTQRGFRNIGTTPAMVMEVFVKEGAATTKQDPGLGRFRRSRRNDRY